MKAPKLDGIIPAMITPFTKGGKRVDYDKAAAFAERLAKGGACGLFVCGTTGQGMLMTVDERKRLLEAVVDAVGKRLAVIAHTAAMDPPSTLELTRHAQECGAKAAGIVTPSFYPYDDRSLELYFTGLAEAVPGFPILLYNIPGCAQNALSADLIVKLARDVDNIVGVKDSSGNMAHINEVIMKAPKDFLLINGADEYGYQAFVSGIPAAVSGTANVTLPIYRSVHENVKKGDTKKAWKSMEQLLKACIMLKYARRLSAYNECLRLQGFDAGYVRAPQRELTPEEKKALRKPLKEAGLI